MAGTPAGRLSVEIVAEIARLQTDLDKAKRQVRAASQDIGRSAKAANDNIAGMGTTMGRTSTMSRAMRANMINLGRQVQDVGTMFALGAPPMQIFASQGAQVFDVLTMMNAEAKATNTSLSRMALGGLAKFGPYALAAAAAAGVLAAATAHIRDEVNETSDVTVTMGDVVLGSFDAIAAAAKGYVSDAFEDMGINVAEVWQSVVDATVWMGNRIIGIMTFIPRMILNTWQTFPGAMADYFFQVVNAAVEGAENTVNSWITAFNVIKMASNEYLGTDFQSTALLELDRFGQQYAGQLSQFTEGAGQVAGDTFTRDFIGEFADYASPFIQERARNRIESESEETGRRAGRAMAREAAESFADAFAFLQRETNTTQDVPGRINSINERIAQLDREAQAVGLIGYQRERLLTILEAEAEINEALARQRAAQEDGREREVVELQALIDKRRELLELELEGIDTEARQQALDDYYRAHEDAIYELADMWETLFTDGVDGLWDMFEKQGLRAIAEVAAQWSLGLISGQSGGAPGSGPLGILGSIFGGQEAANDNGKGIHGTPDHGWDPTKAGQGRGVFGGLLGTTSVAGQSVPTLGLVAGGIQLSNMIGEGLAGAVGLKYDKKMGSMFGIVGGIIGGLLKGSDRGSAIISGGSVSGFYGDSDEFKEQAGTLADSVLGGLSQIADALGADLNTAAGRVSIGIRDGKYRVDPQGRGYTKTSKFPDILDFGDDAEAAVRAAMLDLINDGVIQGISDASLRILKAGKDLEEAIEKAALIESVPKLLAERLDPLGAALDAVDEKFQKLADALREGRATAEQFAQAEQLYNLERKDAIQQFGQGVNALQDFLDSLAFGSNSPLSIRQQLENARADFAQYEQAIMAGEAIDQAAFTDAAQTLLGLSRQANASTSGFFSDFDRIRDLTEMAITNSSTGEIGEGSVVFMEQTAGNTQSIAQQQEETNRLLREINDNMTRGGGGGGRDTWLGQQRAF